MNLEDSGSLNHFLAMFIGDVLESLLLISLIKSCLDSLRRLGGFDSQRVYKDDLGE
jgi:hypothetical protein